MTIMTIYKNRLFLPVVIVGAISSVIYWSGFWSPNQDLSLIGLPSESPSPTSSLQVKPSNTESPSITPVPTKAPTVTKIPLPTGDNRTTFINESVPWSLLLGQASCQLKGEIKFLDHNTYNNQDALLIYNGVDNPARNIFWTVTPQDDLSVGPNLFNRIFIPNGESLLGVGLPENPKYKKYELTAKMQYGRLVDDKDNFVVVGGNVKVFEKQCQGKTTIVLP